LEITTSLLLLTKVEKQSLRRVELEVEVCMRLELGEWLAEIGWVLSVAGMVSIESQSTRTFQDRT